MQEKLRRLSKGRTGRDILEVLEAVKAKVADIRTPLKVKREIENEVRLGIIEAIDMLLVEPLKINSGEIDPPDPNEHL